MMANSTMSATARELTASLRQTNRLLVASLTTKWQVSLSASILGILVVTLGLVFGPFGLGVSMSQGVTSLMRPAVQAAPSAGVILPKLDCASLAPPPNLSVGSVDFTGIPGAPTRIQSASVVPASQQNPEYCDIKGYVDGQNQFELKLPTKTWQGRADQGIPPIATVAYYDAVLDRMGQLTAVQKFARLFMFPSMYHCSTGYGPDMFDTINPIVHWVEKGEAPSRIIATQTDTDTPSGKVIRTRPVFPWPEETKYKGSGSINDAANFVGVLPSPLPDIDIDWVGNDLFNAPEAD